NSTTATLDFTVAESTDLDVRNVYNYPNPTLGGPTRFFFEHNQPPGTPADVELRIYTISGRLIRVIEPTEALPTGVLPGGPVSFTWDGRDTDLDPVATGAYLFKIRVAAEIAGGDRSVYEEVGRLAVLR
ncbi:MAG: FlgD immunoglobulin-like domain containing protein, partial [Bacteroidota bacterium]